MAPPFTSTTLDFHTAAGNVSADVTWSGQATLEADLVCGARSARQVGGNGLFVSMAAPAGSCTLQLSEAVQTDVVVTYTVFLTREVAS